MAYQYDEILKAQHERIAMERAAAERDLEAARLADDGDNTMWHATKILELDAQQAALGQRTNTFVSQSAYQQRQQAANPYGLNRDELDIAHSSFGDSVSKSEKEKIYAEQKDRLRYLRQTGAYRDDQGTVRR